MNNCAKSSKRDRRSVLIVGAGLAGSEAAFFLAQQNISVTLAESKKSAPNPAQNLSTYGELVCSNSLKSNDPLSAHGLLKDEMRQLNSLILEVADQTQIPAGNALAVDRDNFSTIITEKLLAHPNIHLVDQEVTDPFTSAEKYNCHYIVVASGPLTTRPLEQWIANSLNNKSDLYFYDSIAPVVDADSLDMSKMYFADRYQQDSDKKGDYLNIPLSRTQYYQFVDGLINAETVPPRQFEKFKFFEGCMPIDVLAKRGRDTLAFSCMKPVGLIPGDYEGEYIFAVIQLRRENLLGESYNMVGFQNKLTYKAQKDLFRTLPGCSQANFIRLGSIHRNSFLDAKKTLNFDLSSKNFPHLHFAGQICGVEGYTESAAMGLYVAYQIMRKINLCSPLPWPNQSAIGALINYIMTWTKPTPSNINFGLFPPIDSTKLNKVKRRERQKLKRELIVNRAHKVFNSDIVAREKNL